MDHVLDERYRGKIDILPSDWVRFAFMFFDSASKQYVPFPFTNREYLKDIYDCPSRRRLLIFGRQTEKSSTLANIALTYSCLYPYFHALYVSPTMEQTARFSKDRLDDIISISPRLKGFTNPKLAANVKEKGFTNRSRLILRSCFSKPDSVRGIPADLLLIDEIATIVTDHVPIIEECLSHSPYKLRLFSGTPLTIESAAGYYWSHSTQNEWAVPCYAHTPTRFNILTNKNIGKKHLICDKCGKQINAWDEKSQWVSMNSGEDWEGFRVPQIMVPSMEWSEVLKKRESYPTQQFQNEVMAEFSDVGFRPITKKELMDCCLDEIKMDGQYLDRMAQITAGFPVYFGLDWGTGTQSYTVLAMGSYFGGNKFKIFYIHRFEGPEADPLKQLNIIKHQAHTYHVNVVSADYGFGFVSNAKLSQSLAEGEVIYKEFYYSHNPRKRIAYSKGTGKYILHRTQMMSNLFSIMKNKEIGLPCWERFEKPYGSDILNIGAVYNEATRMLQYDHSPDRPDDSFHAILYCFLGSLQDQPRPDLLGIHGIPVL